MLDRGRLALPSDDFLAAAPPGTAATMPSISCWLSRTSVSRQSPARIAVASSETGVFPSWVPLAKKYLPAFESDFVTLLV